MISIKYSKVNQAYFIMWNESVLTVQQARADVESWLNDHDLTVTECWGGTAIRKRG